jgi:D-beta-D-heptose 7-phosphate kinase/D-beta-D-heptose 1-phosphate adenosyltransferase
MQTKVTWLNGCFDVLHAGHIQLFKKAWEQGHDVVVGIDSDERIRKAKGDCRPVNTLENRMLFLQAIKYIRVVIPFNTDEELNANIKRLKPEVFVIGEEYRDKKIIGMEWAKEMMYVPRFQGLSSSSIINGTHNS